MDYWQANSWNFFSRVTQMKALRNSVPEVPSTFSEKVRYRMAYDRRPQLKTFADKYNVRSYVEEKIGAAYLAKVFDVADQAKDIKWEHLPHNFVCKTNHGSGGLVGVWDGVELEAKLPTNISNLGWTRWWVNPENFQKSMCQSMMNRWLKENYAFRKGTYPEWAYSSIKRKIYVEEVLLHSDGRIASPYYFYVFEGKTKLIVVTGRDFDTSRLITYADENWKQLEIENPDFHSHKSFTPFPQKPENLSQMLDIAEVLSGEIDFARVDLYNVDGRIVFSEITNYPSGGRSPWTPAHYETQLGQYWKQDVSIKN